MPSKTTIWRVWMKRKGRRISMVKIKEIARLYLKFNLSIRLIARALNISASQYLYMWIS
jgi:transposase-like protein